MGITISLGLLKISLSCIYLLAWPVIALGYPLFASIRAIENNSKYQMRKLVIYWTLFSLFSLFEFAFVKIIEWIPFWSSVRLVVIFWLVMPQFEGAWLAYQGLVRPVLLVRLQAVIDGFNKLKEERLCKRETFLDVIEKYIKENGSEALEKFIASEHESQKRIDFQGGTKIIKQEEENSAATSKQIRYEQSISSARVLNGTYAITNVKEMTPPEACAENRLCETSLIEKTQQEWTCDICKVTSVSRSMLNAHLLGSRHKSKLESLKASLLGAIDTGPSPSVQHAQSVSAARDLKGTYAVAAVKGIMQPKEMAEKRRPDSPLLEKAQQEWTCDLCKVTTTSEIILNGHLQGRKHKSKLEITLKASKLGAKDEGPSPSATRNLKDGNVAEKLIKESESELEKLIASKTGRGECSNSDRDIHVVESEDENGPAASQEDANAKVKEIAPPKASGAETPTLKEAQQEWTCDLCKVTTTSEITFNGHLHGCKDKSNLESLKASLLDAIDTGPSPLVLHAQSVSANWDPKGTYATADVKEIMPPKQIPEKRRLEAPLLEKAQQEWTCDLCNVRTTNEITFNGHLQGRKHKSKLETIQKASKLGAKDEGPSPSVTSKLKDSYVTEKLIKESESELEKLIASKTGRGECSNSDRDIQVVESEDENGPAASQEDANAKVKEIAPPKASGAETPTLKEAQQEWTCDLCKVTTTSEITFNGHLHGCKDKSNLESLKASLLDAIDTGPSPLVLHAQSVSANWDPKGTYATADVKEIMPPKQIPEKRRLEAPLLEKAQQEWTCDLCNVRTTNEITFNGHLQGRKHNSKLETTQKASKLGAKVEGPSPSVTSKLKDSNVTEKLIKESESELEKLIGSKTGGECSYSLRDVKVLESEDKNGPAASQEVQYANAEIKEITPPKASGTETPTLKEAQQEWTCDLCKVTTTSEITFNGQLHGCKHNSNLESFKASLLDAIDTGPSPLVQHAQSVSAAWDPKGTYAASEIEEIVPPKQIPEKRCLEAPLLEKAQHIWICDLCNVTTTNEITFNSHLQGRKHKSKTALNDGNAAEKLIKESVSKGNLIASKTRRGECSNSHGDVQIVESKEKNGPAASQQYANAEVKETTPPKAQQEQRLDLYGVRGTGEETLNVHLRGSNNKFEFESLKTSNPVGTGIKDGAFPKWCTVCDVKLLSDANVTSHFQGKKHIQL